MTYQQNMYAYLKRKGYGDKYDHAGIYYISLDDRIVYIGKSLNMLRRVAEHYVGIVTKSEKKYRILSQAQSKGSCVGFGVLYNAKGKKHEEIEEEIGAKEGELIRQYMPMLNTQIPKEDNWRKYTYREIVDPFE